MVLNIQIVELILSGISKAEVETQSNKLFCLQTGEMEVKNPLFQDDPTPAQTPAVKNTSDEKK